MFQFDVKNTKAMIEGFDPDTKKEASGGLVPIAKLKLSMRLQSESLKFLGGELEEHYFNPDATCDLAMGLQLRDSNEVFPHKRGETMAGATAQIDYGLGTMHFVDAIVQDVTIHPMAGGMVIWRFTLEVRPDEVQAGKIFFLQKQEVTVGIQPAELKQLGLAA